MNIAITGTGYVGLVTGACLSEVGHNITCFDIDKEKINNLNKGIPPIYEPGLEEMIQRNISNCRLHFTSNTAEVVWNPILFYWQACCPVEKYGSFTEKLAN